MRKDRDINGNLHYKCWNCKEIFNFKAMKYIKHNEGDCPNCEKKIKLK